jgi:hypothetical protein
MRDVRGTSLAYVRLNACACSKSSGSSNRTERRRNLPIRALRIDPSWRRTANGSGAALHAPMRVRLCAVRNRTAMRTETHATRSTDGLRDVFAATEHVIDRITKGISQQRAALHQWFQRSQADISRLYVEDWEAASEFGANTWLTGRPETTSAFLEGVRPSLIPPVVILGSGDRLAFVLQSRPIGTLILQQVCAMPLADQRRLLAWLNTSGRATRVISTTSIPALRLIEQGKFIERLYYRLNTVHCEVGTP